MNNEVVCVSECGSCVTYRSAKVLIMSHYVGVIEPKTIYTTLCTPGQVSAVPSRHAVC